MNRFNIGPNNGLSPIQCQAIIWTNARLLSIGPLGTNFSEILIKIKKLFIHENAFENIVCKMAVILSRGRWVNNKDACPAYMRLGHNGRPSADEMSTGKRWSKSQQLTENLKSTWCQLCSDWWHGWLSCQSWHHDNSRFSTLYSPSEMQKFHHP